MKWWIVLGALGLAACGGDKDSSDGDDTGTDPGTTDTQLEEGRALYNSNCAACHAQDGSGGVGPGMPDAVAGATEADVKDVIQNGSGTMAAINVTDAEADLISEYVIATWGN